MAAGRHNLSRRALLGAGAAACAFPAAARAGGVAATAGGVNAPFALSLSKGTPSFLSSRGREGLRQAQPERDSHSPIEHKRFTRTLAAYRRAEARVAAFKAEEARLPAKRRAFPCEDLEEAFGRLDSLRLAALRRLLRTPAPDVAALSLKLDLAVADMAWELEGCETCLAALAADARRLASAGLAPAD